MNPFTLFKTANQHLLRNKWRSFLTILAIFVGGLVVILSSAISIGVADFVAEQTNNLGGEDYIIITPSSSATALTNLLTGTASLTEFNSSSRLETFSPAEVASLKAMPVLDAKNFYTPRLPYNAVSYITSLRTNKKYNFFYSVASQQDADVAMSVGEMPKEDSDTYEITLQSGFPELLGFKSDEDAIGEMVRISYQNPQTKYFQTFMARIIGVTSVDIATINQPIISKSLESAIYDFYTQYSPSEQKDQIYYVKTKIKPEVASMHEVREQLKSLGYHTITVDDIIGEIRSFFDGLEALLIVFGITTLLVAAIGIANTLLMSVEERTREIGLSKALGMSSLKIFINFSMEAILLGFWGSILGVIGALALGTFFNAQVHEPGGYLEMFPTFELFQFDFSQVVCIILVVMFVAFIAGTIPAWRAAHKAPIDALRYE